MGIKEFYKTNEWFRHLARILLTIVFFASILLINNAYVAIILKYGVYTVGEYQNITPDKKKKKYYTTIEYSYKGKAYRITGDSYTLSERNIGDKVLIKVIPAFPKMRYALEYYYVPRTITAPPEGWEELPPEIQKVGEHQWFFEFVKTREIQLK